MSGIILPVPASLIKYELGRTPPKIEIETDSDGKTLYQGWTGPNTQTSDAGWIITKYIYSGASANVPSHYSTLVGIIWDLRATYSFP